MAASVTKTLVSKILDESKFDPRVPHGPMAIVTEMNSPTYLEYKAIELIRLAQEAACGNAVQTYPEEYDDKIRQAISLLALARAQAGVKHGTVKTQRAKKTRRQNSRRDNSVSGTEGMASDKDAR